MVILQHSSLLLCRKLLCLQQRDIDLLERLRKVPVSNDECESWGGTVGGDGVRFGRIGDLVRGDEKCEGDDTIWASLLLQTGVQCIDIILAELVLDEPRYA